MSAYSLSAQHKNIRVKTDIHSPVSYAETIHEYDILSQKYSQAKLIEYGKSDGGQPIHFFIISPEKIFNADSLKKLGYTTLFINNGIHPGEPDGIKATLQLSKELLDGSTILPKKVIFCLIPIYNVDGALDTSHFFRSGQNGPEVVGFRGNARHLDLNRDFIKCDSENAKTFTKIYRDWDPDVFIDTHVSDGADYQYVMTLIDSQKDKLHPTVSKVMQEKVLPYLYKEMEKSGFPMTPYVNVWGESPDKGMTGFLESPRFASGYSALYNAFPFVTETHMLKPFAQRTESTYQFLKIAVRLCGDHGTEMREARKKANAFTANEQKEFALQWEIDSSYVDSLYFLGYKSIIKKSAVTQRDILSFDQQQPYAKNVAYYNTYKSSLSIQKPTAYLIPQAWHEVIERLRLNQIEMQQLK
ncbi:MAG: M14 family zinc carboxypeptidase, partial [Bdellovibrionales bacterium]